MNTIEAATLRAQRDTQLRHAMDHLLHRLRSFIRVYPRSPDDPLPDHVTAWVTEIDGGPSKVILHAIKMHPEVWASALPDSVCIVRKADLARVAAHLPGAVEAMSANGAYLVDVQAGILRAEFDEAERRRLYGKE